MIRMLACGFCLAILAGSASACINDKELPRHEREFRSNYKGQPAPSPKPEAPASPDYRPIQGGGAALLVAALGVVLYRGRLKG